MVRVTWAKLVRGRLNLPFLIGSLLIVAGVSPAIAGISVTTNINLRTSPTTHSSSTANTSVTASSSATGGDAEAEADTDANLIASVSSDDAGLSYPSGASSQFSSGFSGYSSSLGAYLPPGTSLVLSGTMSASSNCSESLSIASTICSYRIITDDQDHSGSITLRSQAGIPTVTITGAPLSGTVSASLTPTISVLGDVYKLTHIDMLDLESEVSYDLWETSLDDFQDANLTSLAGSIANAIFDLGLESLGLLPGVEVDVGFDMEIDLTDALELDINLRSGSDFLTSYISLNAQTSFDAECESSFEFSPQ